MIFFAPAAFFTRCCRLRDRCESTKSIEPNACPSEIAVSVRGNLSCARVPGSENILPSISRSLIQKALNEFSLYVFP